MVLGVHTLLLFAILAVWQASAQAPGDEDRRCVNQRGDVYPANTRMLMDSRNYEQLITGSSAVWQAVDMDGTGRGVISLIHVPSILFTTHMQVYFSCYVAIYVILTFS